MPVERVLEWPLSGGTTKTSHITQTDESELLSGHGPPLQLVKMTATHHSYTHGVDANQMEHPGASIERVLE